MISGFLLEVLEKFGIRVINGLDEVLKKFGFGYFKI